MASSLRRIAGTLGGDGGPFGRLEQRVLEALWERNGPASVRDLQPNFPEIAYTTLMTTLDRLYRKGVLDRVKEGRAFFYRPRFNRVELQSVLAADAMRVALEITGPSLRPLLSFFVDAVGSKDRQLLDELEELVRARRAAAEVKQ